MATATAPAKEATLPQGPSSAVTMRTPTEISKSSKLPSIPKSPMNGSAQSNGSVKKHSRPITPRSGEHGYGEHALSRRSSGEHGYGEHALSRHSSGEHGYGEHTMSRHSSGSHYDVFAHVHPQGCGCTKCYNTEVTHVGEAYCPNPNTTRFKDYETKVRIIQKIPEMRKVEKTVLVKQLVHEQRTQIVRRSRIVMEDVETWEKVPVIREVPRLKKITVHKIHEEVRTVTEMVPTIEYTKRTRQRTIPKCVMEDCDEIVEVPVIKEVAVVKTVQEPTGEFCEQAVEEYCSPGDFNILTGGGVHHGNHHYHKDDGDSWSDLDSDDEKPHRGRDRSESPSKRKPLSPIRTKPRAYEESHDELKAVKLPETKLNGGHEESHQELKAKVPETKPNGHEESHHELKTKFPETQPKATEAETKAPAQETKPKVLDTKAPAPATTQKGPEVKNPAPDTKTKVPEAAKSKVTEPAKPKSGPEDGKKVDLTKLIKL